MLLSCQNVIFYEADLVAKKDRKIQFSLKYFRQPFAANDTKNPKPYLVQNFDGDSDRHLVGLAVIKLSGLSGLQEIKSVGFLSAFSIFLLFLLFFKIKTKTFLLLKVRDDDSLLTRAVLRKN